MVVGRWLTADPRVPQGHGCFDPFGSPYLREAASPREEGPEASLLDGNLPGGWPGFFGVNGRYKLAHAVRREPLSPPRFPSGHQGAKLFYFSGISQGMYPKTEVNNLTRFISVMKFRPLLWRNSHPYVLADRYKHQEGLRGGGNGAGACITAHRSSARRVEDITDPEDVRQNPKVDRNVAIFGYVRGTHLKPGEPGFHRAAGPAWLAAAHPPRGCPQACVCMCRAAET